LNSIIVTIITATMATLQLWFSVATGTITALIWAVLAFQKLNISNRTNKHVGTTSDKNHSNI
ncbi:hypothetical protein KDA08_05830, partial [Candidatus Saccharibacteria bacterium]|nr:hypothetical protein [Candidatus Saccharibacteria bacterium]